MASRGFTLLAVALPAVLVGGAVVRSELAVRGRPSFRFAVEGYDPRDLLRGRHLEYRVRLDEGPPLDDCDDAAGQRCCLCVTTGPPGGAAEVQRATCSAARARCDGVLDAHAFNGPQRHYVAESAASELEDRLRRSSAAGRAFVIVRIGEDGTPHAQHLELFGQPAR